MTADIVERLRRLPPSPIAFGDSEANKRNQAERKEAADEIERLRAALQSLTKDPPRTLPREPDTDDEVIIKMRAIARAALTENGA